MSKETTYHFELSERKLLLRFLDVSLVLLGLYFIGNIFNFDYFNIKNENWMWPLVLAFYLLFFGSVFEIYDLQKSSNFFKIFKGIVLTASVTILFYLLTPFFTPELPESRIQILYFYISMLISMSVGRLAYIYFINSPIFRKNIILIANGLLLEGIERDLSSADRNYKIKYFINTANKKFTTNSNKEISSSRLKELAKEGINEIVVTKDSKFASFNLYSDLLSLFNQGYVIKEYSQVYEELSGRVYLNFEDTEFYKQFPFSRQNDKPLYRLAHRLFGVFTGIVGLLFLLVLLPLILVINSIANKGPLFYSQERVGKGGKQFKIYKLRSMIVNAEKNGAVWADKNDVRVTKFGKFLRKTRLDELPQFINILKGEMSVIGPRPERPIFVDQLSKENPFYQTRHIVKPGLTGWAQVNIMYGSSVDENLLKLQYDLYYIKHKNVFLDLNIIIKTLSTIIFFKGQ